MYVLVLYLFFKVHFTPLLSHISRFFANFRGIFLSTEDFLHIIQHLCFGCFGITQDDLAAFNTDTFILLLIVVFFTHFHFLKRQNPHFRLVRISDFHLVFSKAASDGGWQPLHRFYSASPHSHDGAFYGVTHSQRKYHNACMQFLAHAALPELLAV